MAIKLTKAEQKAIKKEATGGGRFVRHGGARRRYLDTETGLDYSNREYRNIGLGKRDVEATARNTGAVQEYSAPRAARHKAASARFKSMAQSYVEKRADEGEEITLSEARSSTSFRQLLIDRHAKTKTGKPDNRKRLRALKALGLREDIPDWVKPGDSPKFRKAGLAGPQSAKRFEKAYRGRK